MGMGVEGTAVIKERKEWIVHWQRGAVEIRVEEREKRTGREECKARQNRAWIGFSISWSSMEYCSKAMCLIQ